jgi:dihydrolipoamide dehydrogenase
MRYQVAVIGTGPGGYIAAIRAAQLGFKTVAIEKESRFGGVCLNVGCIPSKALLHDTLGPLKPLAALMKRKEDVVDGLTGGVASLFKKNHIDTLRGEASFLSPHEIKVAQEKVEADNIIIATGSEPSSLPFLPFDGKRVVSSTGALSFDEVPKKLFVVGGGVIGVELASVWSRLGSSVTVFEMLPEIVSTLDISISRSLLALLKRQGIAFKLGVVTQASDLQDADKVLVATGRRPYTKNLNLEAIGLSLTPQGFIPINDRFQTRLPHIYAIGDVIEGAMLAHKAMEEGACVAEIIAGKSPRLYYITLPNVVYTHPEAASVGFTEAEARKAGFELLLGTCPMKAIGRARCNDATDGFVKVIGDKKSGRLLGLHILADQASEMIGEGVLALSQKLTVETLANTFHAHPTLSEAIKEAALGALGRSLNY